MRSLPLAVQLMVFVHGWFGLGLVALFLLIGLTGILFWVRNRDPGGWIWKLLAAAQAGLVLQALIGILLIALGGRRSWLHYAYGVFPFLVLWVAHRFSKRYAGLEWVVFALAGLVIFGLLLRGYMTGAAG